MNDLAAACIMGRPMKKTPGHGTFSKRSVANATALTSEKSRRCCDTPALECLRRSRSAALLLESGGTILA